MSPRLLMCGGLAAFAPLWIISTRFPSGSLHLFRSIWVYSAASVKGRNFRVRKTDHLLDSMLTVSARGACAERYDASKPRILPKSRGVLN